MGLDTSHNCWHGPYSAFSRFRNRLAQAAGYELKRVTDDGFTHDQAQIDWERIERENPGCYDGNWRTAEADPLVYLIAHSDCDGVIHPEQAAPLADRIEALIPSLPEIAGPDDPRTRARLFVDGLREAVVKGEPVDFH